jgi:hypothetical protein
MKDTGHDMPIRYNAEVKAWLVKQLTPSITNQTHPLTQ